MTPPPKGLWPQLLVVALVVIVGVSQYLRSAQHSAIGGEVALQRLDLLYLREPAPALPSLGVTDSTTAVVIFCESCSLPQIAGAQVIKSKDFQIAKDYALASANGQVGPGYAIIDRHGQVRYRSFDALPALHQAEIGRLVQGVQ